MVVLIKVVVEVVVTVSVVVFVVVTTEISVVVVTILTSPGWSIAVKPAANMTTITIANIVTLFSNL